MSKNDPHVRELLRKNQFAEALRYYRTRYNADRPEAMRILQEIQNELSGKPPAGGLVDSAGAPLAPQPAPVVAPKPEPPKPTPQVQAPPPPAPPPPAPKPEPPKLAPVSYASLPAVQPVRDSYWEQLSPSLRHELQGLLEEDRALDAIRVYWRESGVELRDAKERVLRWAAMFPPRR